MQQETITSLSAELKRAQTARMDSIHSHAKEIIELHKQHAKEVQALHAEYTKKT
jgi:hypothetical protein